MSSSVQKLKKHYVIGLVGSLILTLLAFGLTKLHVSSGHEFIRHDFIIPLVLGLAIVQLLVQLVFFLHVGQETKPKWKLITLLFAVMVVAIIFIGSLWVMYNLNYNMGAAHQTDEQIMEDELIHE